MLDDWEELEFRDGKRLVPGYLARAMTDLETYRFTYDEAVREANRVMQENVIGDALDKHIQGHFRSLR
jgi:hypothetical protein